MYRICDLIAALDESRDESGEFRRGIAPEVKNHLEVLEDCLYGLMDRVAYCQLDRHGQPMFITDGAFTAYREAIDAIHRNEGETGKSDSHWFNVLDKNPAGTLDGVIHYQRRANALHKNGGTVIESLAVIPTAVLLAFSLAGVLFNC